MCRNSIAAIVGYPLRVDYFCRPAHAASIFISSQASAIMAIGRPEYLLGGGKGPDRIGFAFREDGAFSQIGYRRPSVRLPGRPAKTVGPATVFPTPAIAGRRGFLSQP